MEQKLSDIAVSLCIHSRFNTRKTRTDDQVKRLADRITKNGFERTRALWAVQNGDSIEVFAGGTRLEAARLAGLDTVPVFIHASLSDEDISRLADLDNENDEYHVEVPLLDTWAEYHRLWKEEKWTQQRIADAKGTDVATVSLRCKLHTDLPDNARRATLDGLLDEGHLVAVVGVSLDVQSLHPWLTTEQAQTELVKEVLDKHRGKTSDDEKTRKPSVAVVRKAAQTWKNLIAEAKKAFDLIEDEGWQKSFVHHLKDMKARTAAAVNSAFVKVKELMAEAAKEEVERVSEEERRHLDQLRVASKIEAMTNRVLHGDAVELVSKSPLGFNLLLTDPPYGMDFQSQRRKTTAKKDKIANDGFDDAMKTLEKVLGVAYERMAENGNAIVFTGAKHEPRVREIIREAGFVEKSYLVWVKKNHGTGDLEGSFAPSHERMIHAVKGKPKLLVRPRDTLDGNEFVGSEHPTEKPLDLLRQLIEATTDVGQVVVDPFAGAGSSLFAAMSCKRDFFGIEIDEQWYRFVVDRIHEMIREEAGSEEGVEHGCELAG